MIYNYYPGCTLSTKAKELDVAARKCAEALGFPLVDLPEWQCCGAVYPMAPDAIAERLSAVRALVAARENGGVLVTLCSACHHVIKRVNDDMLNNEDIRNKVNNYLNLEVPYAGETKVLHYLEVLRDVVGFDNLKAKVVNPLKGRNIGAYYGCLFQLVNHNSHITYFHHIQAIFVNVYIHQNCLIPTFLLSYEVQLDLIIVIILLNHLL